jgi:hypothetical protein
MQRIGNTLNQGIMPGMMGGGGQLALQQLLVVMDGIDNPPFMRRFWTNRTNTLLDAIYVIPYRVGKVGGRVIAVLMAVGGAIGLVLTVRMIITGSDWAPMPFIIILALFAGFILVYSVLIWEEAEKKGTGTLRLRPPRPNNAQIYFIGATNVPLRNLDPALIRPGRMGRHVYFRTPTKEDRKDIFDLYINKVGHEPELDTPERRDEIARITAGYSPAYIDQICSMALTNAHHDGRAVFGWADLLEAMVIVESGTAINVQYIEKDSRAVALHEAGHATAAHVYRPELESSRLSIRMRGDGSLGRHQWAPKEERFPGSEFQHDEFNQLIHIVGAMAAEFTFFGENSLGVGGDLGSTTNTAAWMVGAAGMSPLPLDLHGKTFPGESEDESVERVIRRFEDIGFRLMNRLRTEASGDGLAAVLNDRRKASYAAQFIGEAFVIAYNLIRTNKDKVEAVADEVIEKKEIFGDDLLRLLDAQEFVKPDIDYTDEENWPKLVAWSKLERDQGGSDGQNGSGPHWNRSRARS